MEPGQSSPKNRRNRKRKSQAPGPLAKALQDPETEFKRRAKENHVHQPGLHEGIHPRGKAESRGRQTSGTSDGKHKGTLQTRRRRIPEEKQKVNQHHEQYGETLNRENEEFDKLVYKRFKIEKRGGFKDRVRV